jgi:hypothetical protein
VARFLPVMSLACLCFSIAAQAHRAPRDITVEVIDSHGDVFRQVPVKREASAYRAYLEAERDARYRIRITNPTGGRVGVVVAVDGRNIISGARSELEKNEPMYILAAHDSQEFSGWRANLDEVNEFYFTEWKDSYAEAFGDASARGVIAVAVYREKESRQLLRDREGRASGSAAQSPSPPAAVESDAAAEARDSSAASGSAARELAKKAERSDAGTGYGDRRVEHATQVAFESEPRASERVFLKYEWRETLCGKRILSCDDPPNRFWPNRTYGFAPPPPRR